MNKAINTYNFSGDITLDNIKDVAEAIESVLDGKKYAFVASVGGECPRVRVNQELTQAPSVRYDTEATPPRFAGFNISDTYGVWGVSTSESEKPYITFKHGQITIKHKNAYGETINWVIVTQ